VLEDKLLVWKLKRGSRDALCRIYEKYREDLLRIAAGLLNETSTAEDIVHDVFAGFIRSAIEFELKGSLRGYLTTCVANKARNMNRSGYRRPTVPLDNTGPFASKAPRPDQWIICNEEFKQLTDAMAQLPYEQREAVILHIQGDLKFSQIAAMQETSTKTTMSRYRYGLDKLRSILNGKVTI
jgi:RNA polymerase sigma-70 factor, ECF subfamily